MPIGWKRASPHGRRGTSATTLIRRETSLLDTGGGTRAALDLLGPDPFFVVNGDAFWLNGTGPALDRLIDACGPGDRRRPAGAPHAQVQAEVGLGDFAVDKWGGLRRRAEREVVPYVYAGVQLMRPALLADMPDGAFSMNLAWDRAMAGGPVARRGA